jgi:hypothetical protein
MSPDRHKAEYLATDRITSQGQRDRELAQIHATLAVESAVRDLIAVIERGHE